MITAIVTSDNHLGAYYARLRLDRLEERRRALQRAFTQVIDAAIERRVDLFLHAGDLFDRPDPRNAERYFVARQVRRLLDADIPIFAIAGNHDSPRSLGYDGGTLPQEEISALGAIHLFRATDRLECVDLVVRNTCVCVRGMSSDFNLPDDACPLEGRTAEQQRSGDVDVTLLHYSVEDWIRPDVPEPCLTRANLDRLQTDAICVGHLHTRRETRLPGGAVLLNPGATEHVHFGEERLECGFWILHIEPGQVRTEYVPLRTQPMRTLTFDLSEIQTPLEPEEVDEDAPDPWMARLLAEMEGAAHPQQMLRVRLTGRLPRTRFQRLDLPLLQAHGMAGNFHCQVEAEVTAYDEFADLALGYGVSFDVAEEMRRIARDLESAYGDNPREQELCRLAGQALTEAYARKTGGSR